MADYSALEAVLGYPFKEAALLEQALRHPSWCNEQGDPRPEDNERFEFLGDAVLDLVVSHRVMTRFPKAHEGDLSVTRQQIVSEAALSEVAKQLELGKFILLGKGEEKSGGRDKPKILADMFEALIGAVYLDGGYQAAWEMIDRVLGLR